MSAGVEIVRLSPDDWWTFRDIRLQALKNEPEAFGASHEEEVTLPEEKWRERLENPLLFFARSGAQVVGMIGASLDKHKKSKHIASIYGAYVIPEMRGQGIGKVMLEHLLVSLRENPQVLKVRLNVALTQPSAIALYESAGFKIIATFKKELNIDGHFVDVYEMVTFIH